MDQDYVQYLLRRLSPKWSKYVVGRPNPKQHLFLCLDDVEEVFFGGAAGPGKSWALLAACLQYADCPDHAALIVRKNYTELTQPGGLMDVARGWLHGTDAVWNESEKKYTFPSGSMLQFGHMDNEHVMRRYKGGEYQTICIDELTDFKEREAMFLHSRLRRKSGSKIPLRFRAASNPGGVGHQWVKARYIDHDQSLRLFIPATMEDNPHLDRESYERSLNRLDPVTRERLKRGDWTVTDGGTFIDQSWFGSPGGWLRVCPVNVAGRIRAWDLAASTSDDAKHTAGVRMSRTLHGLYVVEHVVNGKWPPGKRDMVIHSRTQMDGGDCHVYLEEEPGSGGIAQCEYLTKMLSGYRVTSEKASGNKFNRAAPFASQLQAGNVTLVVGEWNAAFIDQLHAADPTKSEKDQDLDMMDAAAKAFNVLASRSLNSYAVETGVEVAEDGEDRPLSGRDPDEDGKESFMGFSYDSDAWEGAWN